MNAIWLKYLPRFVYKRIEGRHKLQAVIGNVGWLMVDKMIRMAVGLFVVVWLARYLGPHQFGLYNYAIALVALLGIVASLGLDGIVIRELVREPTAREELLGTAFVLRLLGAFIAVALCTAAISLLRPDDGLVRWLVVIIAAGTIFQAFDVIDVWFQAKVQSKYAVYAKTSAFLLAAGAKIVFIFEQAPLIAFAWIAMLELAISAMGLVIVYRSRRYELTAWRARLDRGIYLLRESWPLMLSGIAIMIYMRIDQVMLAQMIGDEAVGVYTAATQISAAWYVIPMVIVSSVTPSITEAKAQNEVLYYSRVERLFRVMALLSVAISIAVTLVSEPLIQLLFGNAYQLAAPVVAIHIWASVFVFLGVAQAPWTISEGLAKLSAYRTFIGAVVNVGLNLLLIPDFGARGAAIATVISYALSAVALNALNRRTRRIFWLQLTAFLPRTLGRV